MKLKVEVTQEDIDNGVQQHSEKCPIACALKRLVKNPEVSEEIEFDQDETRFVADLPSDASSFIHLFDEEGSIAVKPFSFEIEAEEKDYDPYD